MDVPFFRHDIGDAEIARMVTTLHSEYLTTAGVTREFEDQFAAYLGS
ncbi:MAG: UDP-4-amino-4,6-dideoxy-N-acetyl-beta-L-altrosamine transaminase, partial [Burkholderiales bacterium]|nr:UDP-4-amino-4,6-dideoxy-N-acetyl-beta-L-altrosamine transaminase [Burkholderiales bacterium]